MIKHIKNLVYENTQLTHRRKQMEVKSKRNYLLKLSDWVENPLVTLSSYEKKLWTQWRAKVKNCDSFDKMEFLIQLEKSMPLEYSDMDNETLDKIFNSYMIDFVSFYVKLNMSDNYLINNLLKQDTSSAVQSFMQKNRTQIEKIIKRRDELKMLFKTCKSKENKIELIKSVKTYINNMVFFDGH